MRESGGDEFGLSCLFLSPPSDLVLAGLVFGPGWGSPVHVAVLMRTLGAVCDEPLVEHGLHFFDGLEPCPATLDAEVLVGSVRQCRSTENA
jgi:hypothetical protein